MILVVDNYDSFTYNLVNLIKLHDKVIVTKVDEVKLDDYEDVTGIVISPGPGHPLDNDLLMQIIEYFKDRPILGVCLGAQALTCYYGGQVVEGTPMHGKLDTMHILKPTILYPAQQESLQIMRYHSLISEEGSFPETLTVTGRTHDAIQSFEHRVRPHFGVQYHPESYAGEYGEYLIQSFINLTEEGAHNDNIKKVDAVS